MQQKINSKPDTDCGVKVSAKTVYLEEYSKPSKKQYLFCYKITIINESNVRVRLLNRHWIILDSNSQANEVKGPGVVGQHPELNPGESHEYYSFCNLETNFGTMEGNYEMEKEDGTTFLAPIPRFFLAENLNEFEKPLYKRGSLIKHKYENFIGVVTDYDMYFINDEELYNKDPHKPSKDKPWYYVLINNTNAISYVPQDHLEKQEEFVEINHPLVDFFFDGKENDSYKRNDKTWEHLRRA
jgi:ApaG protein